VGLVRPVAKCYLGFVAQPVKLSDDLVLDARLTADVSQRSIAGQVEYWARLGRAVEVLMRADHVHALKRLGDARPLSTSLEAVETAEGQQRLSSYLASRPFPQFEAAVGRPGLLVKVDEDGTRTFGRFVQRVFTPVEAK
jgi:ParD-like antitoxin of type II bacterial toxin-antitoxin system